MLNWKGKKYIKVVKVNQWETNGMTCVFASQVNQVVCNYSYVYVQHANDLTMHVMITRRCLKAILITNLACMISGV